MNRDEGEIQKADPEHRKRVLGVLVVVALAGVLGLAELEGHLRRLEAVARSTPHQAMASALLASRLFLGAVAAGAVCVAAFLGHRSWRTVRSGRHPPPGVRVIRDTRVVRGRRARLHGWIGLGLALLILLAGVLVPWRADRTLRGVLDGRLQPILESPEELSGDRR